jgi:surfactin synthase thioesterase subunit
VTLAAVSLPAGTDRDPAAGWLRWIEPRPYARLTLLCLPHAGGGASSFKAWGRDAPPEIDVCAVQLPGRENRTNASPLTDIDVLLDALLAALQPHLGRPYAIYGHSLGALIGFELVRRLRRQRRRLPVGLFVGSRRAPQLPSPVPTIHRMPDEVLVQWLKRAAGTADLLLTNERWLRFYLPALRADLSLSEGYRYTPEAPLPCPIFAFGGSDDAVLAHHELDAWRVQTRDTFRLSLYPGGHLFHLAESSGEGTSPSFRPEMLTAHVTELALGLLDREEDHHE